MSVPLNVALTKLESETVMEVSGWLDGHAVLPDLGLVPGRLIIDLFELTFMNSLGIRTWVNWIKTVRAEKGITIKRCSPPFVKQLSILHSFIPFDVTVESICVPYYCEECDREEVRLIQVGAGFDTLPAEIICIICHGEMSMDVVKETYFKFWDKKAG